MSEELLDDRQRRFVLKPRIATLATVRRDGSPHVTPVWFRYEDGDFLVSIDLNSQKKRNIEHDTRVELCIDDREKAPFHTVIVRGRATIEPAPSREWREALAMHYLGEERGRRYIEQSDSPDSPDSPDSVLVRIRAERIAGW